MRVTVDGQGNLTDDDRVRLGAQQAALIKMQVSRQGRGSTLPASLWSLWSLWSLFTLIIAGACCD